MEHRHFLGSSQYVDDDHDQRWNRTHPEHPDTSLARSGTSENRSHVYPAENILNEGMLEFSHWNSSPQPNAYPASGHPNVERPYYNPGSSSPSQDPFVSSTVATFSAPHDNYVAFPASSNCNNQTWSNASYVDRSMENVRGVQKRKAPCGSSNYEMGSSSQYHSAKTSSGTPLPVELRMGKSIKHDHDPHYLPWLKNPTNKNNNLLIREEGSSRNIRRRPTLDLETTFDRHNLSRSPSLDSHYIHHHSVERSGLGQFPGHTSHVDKDWNCARNSAGPRDINGFSPETNNFLPPRSVGKSSSLDTSSYHHGLAGNMNPTVSQGFPGTSTQFTSSSRSCHRSLSTYRSSSHSLRSGHETSSSRDRSHLVTEAYPSKHLRPVPHISWRSGDRPGRRRSSYGRFQPPFDEVAVHEQLSSEEFMIVDGQPDYYGSRNTLDYHRDMRLDIDNMTYEDLLALGERIGSVNTGLSDSSISSCLLATTYHPSNQTEEQRKCAICLEEYKEKEECGEVKVCGHDYHWSCIKKWLLMKNSCPICKSPALPDVSNNPS